MDNGEYQKLYREIASGEQKTKALLIQFEKDYPGELSDKNIDEITAGLQKTEDRESVLAQLRELQTQKSEARPEAKTLNRDEPER